MAKSILQSTWDLMGAPFRLVLFDQEWLDRFHWTTLEDERVAMVLPHVTGRLLDIGAGKNTLVKRHGNGVGVDVVDWGNDVHVVEDTSKLPYRDGEFDTVTLIACLNHIPYRDAVLVEARRVLKPGGRLVITMINPILGGIGHVIWWYGEDRHRGGMKEGEVGGMWNHDIVRLCKEAGFTLREHRRFVYAMNNLLVFEAPR